MVDTGSSANVLFWEVFKRLDLPKQVLREHRGSLLGFAGESVEIIGYVDLHTTFSEGENAKTIVIKYIVVNARILLQHHFRETDIEWPRSSYLHCTLVYEISAGRRSCGSSQRKSNHC